MHKCLLDLLPKASLASPRASPRKLNEHTSAPKPSHPSRPISIHVSTSSQPLRKPPTPVLSDRQSTKNQRRKNTAQNFHLRFLRRRCSPPFRCKLCSLFSPSSAYPMLQSSKQSPMYPSRPRCSPSSCLDDLPRTPPPKPPSRLLPALLSPHAVERLEDEMVRNPSNNLAHLLLDLPFRDPRLDGRIDRKSEHGEDGERDLRLVLGVGRVERRCEGADRGRLSRC